ncbi:MAG TPA: transporter substrate-binding domain-containing protein [Azospirillum sp.]|nr:transporter substrate-binding domain-containing protein [Azospirillum sp.]
MIQFLLLLLALFVSSGSQAADKLFIGTGVGAPYVQEDRQGFLDLLVAEVFRRLGQDGEIQVYASAERALMNANSGLDDGDAMRVAGLETIYPNLVRVPEKVVDNDFVAYSLRHDTATPAFEALRPYALGYIVGWKIFEANLGAGFQTATVQDAEQLFTLLANDRADMVLFEEWQGRWIARKLGLPVKVLAPPLVHTEMFMYLHRKHTALAAPAAEALRAMKADGTYQGIAERTLLRLLQPQDARP